MVVPFSGRPTADEVRVPVWGRFATVFAASLGSPAYYCWRSHPCASVTQISRWPRGFPAWAGFEITILQLKVLKRNATQLGSRRAQIDVA
jgi:hypothetical protein